MRQIFVVTSTSLCARACTYKTLYGKTSEVPETDQTHCTFKYQCLYRCTRIPYRARIQFLTTTRKIQHLTETAANIKCLPLSSDSLTIALNTGDTSSAVCSDCLSVSRRLRTAVCLHQAKKNPNIEQIF